MHEIGIAKSIIEIAEAKAREQNSPSIQLIKIRLGDLTAVSREALEFGFEVARRGTLAENATLEIENVQMLPRCAFCGPVSNPIRNVLLMCPQCGLPIESRSEEELQVEYVELE
jgi:hydrogenase nickel incorporation protein HypA/HybF